MRMTCDLPDHAAAVEALLEGFVRCCALIISSGLAPADPRGAGVVYKLEPAGEEDWKLPHNVIKDGWGDCEDIAGWRAGGLRATGEDPDATVKVAKTGKNKLHAIVMRGDGTTEDPCKEMWLNQPEGRKHLAGIGAMRREEVTKPSVPSFAQLAPGQIVAPTGQVVDVSSQSAIVRDHRKGGEYYVPPQKKGPFGIDWSAEANKAPPAKQYLRAPEGTNWVASNNRGLSIDPATGQPYAVNPATGRPTPYGYRQGLQRDPVTGQVYDQSGQPYIPGYSNPYDPYGQYGYGNPYDPYGYGQYGYGYPWAPQEWFDGYSDPTWGGGGYQADGSWVDPRAVELFAEQGWW
jgi:hypothetical protein